ncbi:MAG: hypothetical protein WCJ75_06890 [Desulfomonile sp.]|jgi:hypothetical protein
MIKSIFVMAAALMILLPSFAIGEEQIRDQNGVVIEIRQQQGNMSYAYDGNRNLRYVATSIPGNQEVVEYRDKYGVHTGIGGPGTLQWAVGGPIQFDVSGQSSVR